MSKKMSSDEEVETNFTAGKEKELEDLLSKLDFISNIQEDEIIYVNSLSKAGHGWSTSLHRTVINCGGLWTTESKDATLDFFRNTIDEAFADIGKYIKKNSSYSQEIVKVIMEHVTRCRKGIENFKKTCEKRNEAIFVSHINSVLKILEMKISNLKVKLNRRNSRKHNSDDLLS